MAITDEHPEYREKKYLWQEYRDLYQGGDEFNRNASNYLVRRQKEPGDVYAERLSRVFYENYVGSIIDWYAATVLRDGPQVQTHGGGGRDRAFYSEFLTDCDLRGTPLRECLREQLVQALVYGSSYLMLDFPRASEPVETRADEIAQGLDRAYMRQYAPLALINWNRDDRDELEWVVLRESRLTKADVHASEWEQETYWTYLDRTSFKRYRRRGERGEPELIEEGEHAMAALRRVPLFEIRLTQGLWLMRRAASVQLEHFNKSNGLGWALTMGLFAMPVVYSDREFKQMIGESYFIQLGPEDKFGWTEPAGHVYRLAAENLTRLQREIYRLCHLQHQGTETLAPAGGQSGFSKERDFLITEEVLRALGRAVRDTAARLIAAIGLLRQDGVRTEVSGMDRFDVGEFEKEIEDVRKILSIGIASPTFRKQAETRLALMYLGDANGETRASVAAEIAKAEH